jgi:hypothetical protein
MPKVAPLPAIVVTNVECSIPCAALSIALQAAIHGDSKIPVGHYVCGEVVENIEQLLPLASTSVDLFNLQISYF